LEVVAELGNIKIVGSFGASLEYAYFVVVRGMMELFVAWQFGINGNSVFDRKCVEELFVVDRGRGFVSKLKFRWYVVSSRDLEYKCRCLVQDEGIMCVGSCWLVGTPLRRSS
jgi:hypothetical protein